MGSLNSIFAILLDHIKNQLESIDLFQNADTGKIYFYTGPTTGRKYYATIAPWTVTNDNGHSGGTSSGLWNYITLAIDFQKQFDNHDAEYNEFVNKSQEILNLFQKKTDGIFERISSEITEVEVINNSRIFKNMIIVTYRVLIRRNSV